MKRAAIYARYSTKNQSDMSVEDQIALCSTYAARSGYEVVATFSDAAKTGSSMIGRDGLAQFMDAAERRQFSVVLVETAERLARSQADLPNIKRLLDFYEVGIVMAQSGRELDANGVLIEGLSGQQQREKAQGNARRGMIGQASRGKIAAGKAYGYRANPNITVVGNKLIGRGEHIIVETEAEIIIEIWTRYANGEKARAIAADLNRRGIPSPRKGGRWNASTINGSVARGTGILRNELYGGIFRFPKNKMVTDPRTNKRVSRPVPIEEQVAYPVPHMQIVPTELFEKVMAMKAAMAGVAPQKQRRPTYLLTGLLKCGSCGAGLSRAGGRANPRLACSAHVEGRACPDPRTYVARKIENVVIEKLRSDLMSPRVMREFIAEYQAERARLASTKTTELANVEAQLRDKIAKGNRLHEMLVDRIGDEARNNADLKANAVEEAALKSRLADLRAEAPSAVVSLHPKALDHFLGALEGLRKSLANPDSQSARIVRQVIESVTVFPKGPARNHAGGDFEIEIRGHLDTLLQAPRKKVVEYDRSSGQI